MIDSSHIRLRVRHFLLQQSVLFQRSIANHAQEKVPVSMIARELAKQIKMPARRLQKYLAKDLSPKDLSITLTDLELIADLKKIPLSQFLGYLLQEKTPNDLEGWRKNTLEFFESLHEGHRRALSATLFSGKNQQKSEKLIELLIQLYTLNEQDLSTVESIVGAFKLRKNLEI